jgi:hypothetical protein
MDRLGVNSELHSGHNFTLAALAAARDLLSARARCWLLHSAEQYIC